MASKAQLVRNTLLMVAAAAATASNWPGTVDPDPGGRHESARRRRGGMLNRAGYVLMLHNQGSSQAGIRNTPPSHPRPARPAISPFWAAAVAPSLSPRRHGYATSAWCSAAAASGGYPFHPRRAPRGMPSTRPRPIERGLEASRLRLLQVLKLVMSLMTFPVGSKQFLVSGSRILLRPETWRLRVRNAAAVWYSTVAEPA